MCNYDTCNYVTMTNVNRPVVITSQNIQVWNHCRYWGWVGSRPPQLGNITIKWFIQVFVYKSYLYIIVHCVCNSITSKKCVSVQFSHSVMSDSLRPHGLKYARLTCPHHLPELAQIRVHWAGDAILPSHPLLSPSPAFTLSQHQCLFQWVGSSHQVAKVLECQPQQHSLQWIFRTDFLLDWPVGSPCSPRDSQESSPTLQFKSINSSVLSFLYSPTLTSIYDYWKNQSFD